MTKGVSPNEIKEDYTKSPVVIVMTARAMVLEALARMKRLEASIKRPVTVRYEGLIISGRRKSVDACLRGISGGKATLKTVLNS